jgi:hypothetical protein
MRDAVVLTDWHVAECLRLTNGNQVDKRLLCANRLLEWMKAQPSSPIGLRQILQYGPNSIRSKQKAEDALKVLLDHGQVVSDANRDSFYRVATGASA